MSESQEPWTSGPWEYRDGGAEVFGPAVYAEGAHDLDPLAAVDHISENSEANARLIALAPEMATWITEALEWLHTDDGHDLVTSGAALLARARGEEESGSG
jgi:hypothetical protein